MAKNTEHYGLVKPAQSDFYNVDDFNGNADIIDSALQGKVDKVSGKGLSANDYTTAEKAKVAAAVPNTRKVNGKALSADITLNAADVGADVSGEAGSVQSALNAHKTDMGNPHGVTATQIGAVNLAGDTMTGTLNFQGLRSGTLLSGGSVGEGAIAQGLSVSASGPYSHAHGNQASASGSYSYAQGYKSEALATSSHVEGELGKVSAANGHAEGTGAKVSGINGHAEGYNAIVEGYAAHAEGRQCVARGYASHAEGYGTVAVAYSEHVQGMYNVLSTSSSTTHSSTDNAFVIGNGTFGSNHNAFRVTYDGKVYALSAFNSSGADYAEYFEWMNRPQDDEPLGYFVTLEGEKIRVASDEDEFILGISTVNSSVIGNGDVSSWTKQYIKDRWGRPELKSVECPREVFTHEAVCDCEGNVIVEQWDEEIAPKRTEIQFALNPEYDSTQEYKPRESRPEWACIGMLGRLWIKNDGSCQVNSYCKPNKDGIATKSSSGYRVIRVEEDWALVLFR